MEELLEIGLLGTFRIRYKGKAVSSVHSPRIQELLTYLIVHRDAPRQRQQIALDFWADSPEKQTLANLRQLLYQLRNALPEADRFIKSDSNTIQWNPDVPCRIDIIEFSKLIKKARQARDDNDRKNEISALEKAVSLYRGPLLSNCFEDWITADRKRLEEDYLTALERLIDILQEERKFEEALNYGEKLLEQDPCSESACRRMIQLHALNEDRTAVIRTYQAFEKKIRQELDIEPGPKTKELYQRLSESFRIKSADSTTAPLQTTGNGADKGWPMVGRTKEWNSLLEAWDQACSGNTQWVLIRGETGIGKSRLGRELQAYLAKQGYASARSRCYEAPGTPGYGPVADWLRSPSFSSKISQLDEVWLDELSRLLPEFSERLQNMPDFESWQQRRFEEALAKAVMSVNNPAFLLLEELQWCDPETLGWLEFLLNRDRPIPLLVTATLRTTAGNPYANEALDGLLHELRLKHRLRVIEPTALNKSQTKELASKILNREIGETIGSILYRETEGNPLFIVEMTRELHLLEQLENSKNDEFVPPDQTPSQIRKLPRLINEVISGRFRYLSPKSREVLSIAAAAGREFSFKLISRSSDLTENELLEAFEELIRQHIFRELEAEFYDFTHDKLREVAYKELSSTRRRRLHLRIAEAISEIHKDDLSSRYTRLAFHYERAGEIEDALDQYVLAARHARNVTSLQDVGMLHRAIELLHTLPEGKERDLREFELTHSLAISYLQRRRFDTEEIFKLCERVYRLSSELSKPPPTAILFMLGVAKLMSGDPAVALELGLVMHSMVELTDKSAEKVEACYLLGLSNRITGNLKESAQWYEKGLNQFEEAKPLTHMQIYDIDGSIMLRMEAAFSFLITGREKEARKLMDDTAASVKKSQGKYGNAYIYYSTACFESLIRNSKETRKNAEEFLDFGIVEEPMHWNPQANILLGWSLAAQGYPHRGIERIQDGINQLEELNYTLELPYYYVLFAESLTAAGAYDKSREAINRAKEIVNSTGARFAEAEILRVEGELFLELDLPDSEAASASLKRAAEIAREQGALLFENRSTTVLEHVE